MFTNQENVTTKTNTNILWKSTIPKFHGLNKWLHIFSSDLLWDEFYPWWIVIFSVLEITVSIRIICTFRHRKFKYYVNLFETAYDMGWYVFSLDPPIHY